MTSFYIVPPRKTQLGDNGISISGTLGVITTNPGGAAITGVGALRLDTTYSPTWTGIHTFTQPIVFSGSQVINSTLISTPGQTAGDLFYYSGTSWSRLAVGSNNQVLQSFGGGIGWTGGVNLTNVITGNLKIGSLSGVLKASSGVVSGNSGIGDLSNVLLNLPASGNFLKYNGTNWVNSPIPLSDHNIIIRFLNGYTPSQTGIDIEVATVPYEPSDGTTILEYTITRIVLQTEIAGSTSSQVTIERALNGQEFDDPMTLGNTIETLTLSSGSYQVSSNGPFFKIYSGERLRLNIDSIGTGAQQWTVQVEGTAGNPYNGTNAGITSINSLAAQLQTMVVGSGGTDFNITSVIDTHTFNIPNASASNRGLVTLTNQTFAGVKTFNNTSVTTSTTTGALIINGGVGVGESIYVGGNVVVGNNLILNNALGTTFGGTGLSNIGESNTFLSVNNAGNALEYKKLIAGTGITFNFSGSEIILESTGGTGVTGVISGGGISSLNGISYINYPEQTFAVGSSGTDFNIESSGSTHTFNLPEAGSGSSGIVTTASQSFAGEKTFDNNIIAQSDLNVSGSTNLTSAVGVSSSVNISGGLGVTAATILRSTLQVSGVTTILNNTNTSSSTSGALIVSGGIGASGSLYVGSGANINSNNISSATTSSGLVFTANSLTTGTGAYIASNSLTTGKLLDIAVSGNTAIGARVGVNVTVQGANVNTGVTTYGIFTNNTSTNSGTNIGLGSFASGGTNNIPLRLGLNTSRYINFFINSEGNGLTLSPTATGTPFLALGGYSGVSAELRLLQSGGIGLVNYVALKAPVAVTNTYELIFPNTYPASSNMALVGTGTTQVTLSWSSLSSGGIGGTINAGDQYKLAFYANPNGSSVLDDAQALNYSTSGANLTINSTAASVVPLKLVGAVSQTANLFQVATSSGNILTVDKDGATNFTNDVSITSATGSMSSSTGALKVSGGLGVQGSVTIGTGLSVASASYFSSTVDINSLRLSNSLSLIYGGTGLGTSGLPNQILGMNSNSSALEYKTFSAGFGITISHSSNSISFSVTSAGSGISSINGLSSAEQAFEANSNGTNFNIVSIGSTHTFNLPSAGSGSSGIITTSTQTISGNKSFNDIVVVSGLGVTNDATFRSTVDIYGGVGVSGQVTLRSTLAVSGIADFTNITNSSSTSTGSVVVSGGIGVGGTVYTNNLYVLGSTTLANALSVSNGGTGTTNGSITGSGTLTFTAGGTNNNINLVPNGNGTVDVSSKRITSVATPTNAYDAATKAYVDQIAQGINYHDHVEAATTAGLGATYQNGVLGVGSTLQASPAAGWSTSYSDGVILTVGDRILVKNQSGTGLTVQNGIYTVSQMSSPWILTRSSDYDNSISGSVAPGDTVWVAFGDTLQYTTWTQATFGTGNSSGGILIGTDPISYIQTSGAGSYNGDGSTISITGSIISIAPGYVGQTSITTLGTISTGSWNASVINVQYGGTGASTFTSNGVLYGNNTSSVQSTNASSAVGALLTTATSGGSPLFSNTLQGQYVISNNTNTTSSTQGALTITGGLGVSGNIFVGSNLNVLNAANIDSGIGISGNTNITGGLGVTGASLFRSSVIIQSGGVGVTGGVIITQGGLGVTGATVLNSSLTVSTSTILNSTLNVVGNANFASALNVGGPSSLSGLGVSGNLDITGGVGISGKTIFRDSVIIQSGGLGVTGGIIISQGGLGVTGATILRSTLSVLGTASFATINQGTWNGSTIGLSYGGTGLGVTGTANQMLGMSNDSTSLEYKTLIAGSNVTILNSTNSITISATSGGGGGSGVVNTGLATQVAYYAVGGTSVSGTSNLTVGSSGVGISFNTQSTSSTSGSLVVAGGIGVSGNVRVGSGLGVSGSLNFVSGTFGNVGASTFTLNFLSSGNSPISLNVLSDNSLSFEGSSGQLLSISNNLSTGFIYSINNISGLPLLRANANGNISMGEFVGNVGVGTSTPQFKFHVIGDANVTGGFGVSGLANISGGLGVTGHTNLSSTLIVQGNLGVVSGLGVTGSSLFRSSVIVQSGGLGVTGGIVVTQGGLGVTGATVLRSTLSVLGTASFATINQGTWNGSTIGIAYGGTGLGSSGTANQFLGMSNDSTSLEYKTLIAGSNVTILNSTNSITISAATGGGSGSGTVNSGLITQVAYYAVGGTSVSGTSNLTVGSSGVGISFNTQSTSSSTGALIVLGGFGVSGNVNVGTGLTVLGTVHAASNTNSTSSTSGALIITGGIGVSGRIWAGSGISSQGGGTFTGALSASSLTLATALPITSGGTGIGTSGTTNQILGMSSTTSELEYKTLTAGSNISISHGAGTVTLNVVGAGISSLNGLTSATQTFSTGYSGTDFNIVSIGSTHTFNIPVAGSGSSGIITTQSQTIAGAKTFSSALSVTASTTSTSSTSGALIVTGGVGISGNLNVGTGLTVLGAMHVASNTNSTSSTSGALVVTGGIGVSGRIFGGTGLSILGGATFNSTVTINDASILNSTLYIGGATIIQSGGLGVTGGIIISQGGLGVTGATVLRSTLSVLGTASFATINQGTWNGSTIGLSYGGTGLGTTGTDNQLLGMSNNSTSLEYKTLIAGSNISILNSTNSITISATSGGGGSGTVNSGLISQVAYYAVGGTSVSGTANMTIGSSGVGISFATQSTSSTSGALIVFGGIGVSGNLNVGTGLTVLGTIHAASNVNSTSSTSGSVVITGGIGVSGRIWAGSGISSQGGGTFTGALSASSLTLSTALPITSGGTGIGTSGTVNQILGMSSTTSGLEYKTLTAGSNISISHGAGTVTLNVVGAGISSLNGLNNSTQTFTTGTSGTEFNIVSIGSTHTFNLPAAGSGSSGVITTGTQTIAGTKTFTGGIIVQSAGLGVTGGIVVTQGGLGVTGATVLNSSLTVTTSTILNSTLNIVGNTNIASDVNIGGATNISGLGVSNNINITGGLGISGTSLFRSSVIIQSGGLGVSGGIIISQGGLGVTGAAVFNSSISAGSLSLSTALPLSSGGTGLGSTSLANYILGMNNSSLGLEYKQIVEGSNITITHNTNSITIAAASSSSAPGGPNSAIQYNGSGTLAGVSAFLWDNASQRIDIKNTNAIGTGTTASFLLQNSTASTVSVQMQFSPAIEQIGRAWKTSGSPATDTLVRYLQMVEVTSGATPAGAITWKSAIHNASNQGPTYVKRAEISTIYGLGIYETTGVYKSSIVNSASATTDIYYTLPAALPSLNQALTVTGISVSSVTLSWISNGTVASGATGALAYYSGTGTTVDDATGLAYASSGTHLIITSQNATDVPLRVDGHTSSSVNLFQVRKGTNDQLVINSSGNVSILSSEASIGATSGALIVAGGVGIGGTLNIGADLSISGLTTLTYTSEKLNTKTSATGTVTHDLSTGSVFYHSSISNNFTANFTNVPTTNDRAIGVTLVLAQGVTPYMSTALQIDGSAQTIKWVNNSTPTGTASKVDIVGFSLIRTGSAWTVLGQYSTYG